jgi:Uma2 family endonuclease
MRAPEVSPFADRPETGRFDVSMADADSVAYNGGRHPDCPMAHTMATTVRIEDQVEIPMNLQGLADFRRWAVSDAFPERGRIDYLAGSIEVDMSPEDLHTHGKLKVELVRVLADRVAEADLGELYTDRARVSSPEADLSVEPDVVLVTNESLDSGRVRLVPRAGGGEDRYIELEGAPDLVVEIVSDSSVRKDTNRLPGLYYTAGVREFWLVDARRAELVFRIHQPGAAGYEPAPASPDGFQYSAVLDRWYQLHRTRNRHGRIAFELHQHKT